TASNPARAGDVVLVYATGLGATTPALTTGALVPVLGPAVLYSPATVTATVDGRNATVQYTTASPGFAGLYQVALTIPTGVTGSVPVVIMQGTSRSNAVNIEVR